MAKDYGDSVALKALQDEIYREEVLRSRSLTAAERVAEICDLSNSAERQARPHSLHRPLTYRADPR